MILMWQVTGFPARILAPILIAFAMELNEGAAPNYIGLMLCAGQPFPFPFYPNLDAIWARL
jgi:hypothetical protein